MKKRISIMLAVVLVLVTIMAVCLMGCETKKKDSDKNNLSKEMQEAFKDVDMKDAKAILGVVDKAINDGNITITRKSPMIRGEESGTITMQRKLDGSKMAINQEQDLGEKIKYSIVYEIKGENCTSYMLMDGKWIKEDEGTEYNQDDFKESVRLETGIEVLKTADFKYDSEKKNFTGSAILPGVEKNVTFFMSVVENGIEIKMKVDGNEQMSTILISDLGSTKVTIPDVETVVPDKETTAPDVA